jgi:hypothetical protein
MWAKVGSNIKLYNDMLSKSTTSTNIDKDTWELYTRRNSVCTGTSYPEEDQAPYILPDTAASKKIKKIFL